MQQDDVDCTGGGVKRRVGENDAMRCRASQTVDDGERECRAGDIVSECLRNNVVCRLNPGEVRGQTEGATRPDVSGQPEGAFALRRKTPGAR